MSTLLSAITTVKHNTNGWAFTSVCHNVNNTSCLCCYYGIGASAYCRYASVVIVGKQQWGSIYIPSDTRIQVSFPITYNSIPCAIALSNQGEKNTDYAAAYSDLTQSSVYLADNKDTVHFIVLGT